MTNESPGNDEWLTVNDAAELAGRDPTSIRRSIKRKLLRAEKFGPMWRIRRADLEAFLEVDLRGGPRPPEGRKPPEIDGD